MYMTWFLLIFLLQLVNAHEREAWRDPNDPTREHRPRNNKPVLSSPPALQKFQPDQSLRLIIRQLLLELQIDYQLEGPVQRDVQVTISRHSMLVLSKYLNSQESDIVGDREAVRSALSNIFKVQEAAPDPTWNDTFLTIQPFIFTVNLFLLPAAAVVVVRSLVRPRNFWILVFSTVLIVSMYSGYNRKYQEAEARRFAQFQESSRDACAPEGMLSRMIEIVASPFQYSQKSNCLKYIESQTVSIFHEISIIEVFSETISSGFFSFMSASAKHFNLFFRNLYEGTPIMAQIVMTFFLILSLGVVRTPFFSYEPIWLKFCNSSLGKIVGWLEGGENQPAPATIQLNLTKKEVKRIEAAKIEKTEKAIEYPKSEREDEKEKEEEKRRSEDDVSLLGECSEDEDVLGDSISENDELNQTIYPNEEELSDTSF